MMKRTHITISIVSAILAVRYFNLEPITCIIGSFIGSIAPDLDFKFKIRHRTITHSLLFLFISSIFFVIIDLKLGIGYFIGNILHLIADSFTKMGVPFLYPFIKKRYGVRLIKTNGYTERLFLLVLIYFFVYIIY